MHINIPTDNLIAEVSVKLTGLVNELSKNHKDVSKIDKEVVAGDLVTALIEDMVFGELNWTPPPGYLDNVIQKTMIDMIGFDDVSQEFEKWFKDTIMHDVINKAQQVVDKILHKSDFLNNYDDKWFTWSMVNLRGQILLVRGQDYRIEQWTKLVEEGVILPPFKN